MTSPVLLLDVMGTLVTDPFFREIPAFFGMSLPELIEAKHPSTWLRFERGEIDEGQMVAEFFADGRPVDGEGLRAAAVRGYAYLDGIEPLLTDLRAAGVPMHALSNYGPWYALIDAKLNLSRFLSWSFVSCKTGVRKPDPRAYLGAAEALGVPASACVFVDDRPSNCAAARAVGMRTVCFGEGRSAEISSVVVLRARLSELGVSLSAP